MDVTQENVDIGWRKIPMENCKNGNKLKDLLTKNTETLCNTDKGEIAVIVFDL